MTDSVNVTLPGDSTGNLTCIAHAAYFQRVTIALSGQTLGVFSGSGENKPMLLADGTAVLRVGPNGQAVSLNLTFEFSPSGSGGPFSPANVQQPIVESSGNATIVTVTSEDSTDNDDNDSYLIFSYVTS